MLPPLLKSSFHPTFWVANVLELFERLAFYAMKAVLVVFLADSVGLKDQAGTLAGLFGSAIFFFPVFAGVLVDQFGFRRMLILCFSIFSAGYFLLALAGSQFSAAVVGFDTAQIYVILVLIMTALGGSLIKPCIVGTVSATTSETQRAPGFSIYYTLVNLGGTIGPLLALTLRESLGINYVLILSSVTSLLLVGGTLLFFREPPRVEPQLRRSMAKVGRDFMKVISDFRFMSFLVLFSGFWICFWQIYYLLPFYVKDVLQFGKFELIESVDAACIILLTIPATMLVKKWKPITAIIIGFLVAAAGWSIIGGGISLSYTIVGISIFALGEAIQSPRFYEYVSKLAPPEQVGTYMGFAFLPVALGALVAGVLADYLRNNFLMSSPQTMWLIVASIALISTVLMFFYNLYLAPKSKTDGQ